jgi:hypothetical protein
VMATALAKKPDARYPTCMAFARALAAACGVRGEAVETGADAPPPALLPTDRAAQIPASRVPTSGAGDQQPGAGAAPAGPAGRAAPAGPAGRAGPAGPAGQRDADPQDDAYTAWGARPMYRPDTEWRPAPDSVTSHPSPWSESPPPQPPGQYRPRAAPAAPRRGRAGQAVAGVVVGVVVVLAAAGVAFFLLHHKSTSGHNPPASSPPSTHAATSHPASSAPVTALGPAATVHAYFAAINAHDYAKAWALGGKNIASPYSKFAAGFTGTARDKVTVVSVADGVVTVRLAAIQTDGSVKRFAGTYTVANGLITASSIQPVG